MKFISAYSLILGQRIEKPILNLSFYSLPFNDYITIQPYSKNSKNFSYWNLVIEIIRPYLEKLNIKIVQIGGKGEQELEFCHSLIGRTTIRQAAYIVSGSKLHVCTDSWTSHYAGYLRKPLVVLIANNTVYNSTPYWFDEEKTIVFQPDRIKFLRPSFSLTDQDKQIDSIHPEEIAFAVLKLLDIKDVNYNKRLRYTGFQYYNKVVEMVPNVLCDVKSMNIESITVRMDYLHDEACLGEQLKICTCSVVCDRPIDLTKLQTRRIVALYYVLDESYNLDFIKKIAKSGIKFALLTYKDSDWLQKIKIDIMDYGLCHEKKIDNHQSLDEIKNIKLENLVFRSNKIILSGGKLYPSKYHWLTGDGINSLNCPFLDFVNNSNLLRDIEHLQIYEKI